VTAHVGQQGITTHPHENYPATPAGSFTLTQAFGALPNPGAALPYFVTSGDDWWVSQEGVDYNTHQVCSGGCSFTTGSPNTQLVSVKPEYDYAVVIDYNRFPAVPEAGSAFFLHVTTGVPTNGCVSVGLTDLIHLLRWLNPTSHPRILIGIHP